MQPKPKSGVIEKMTQYISQSPWHVFLSSEFKAMGSAAQVSRCINALVQQGVLIKVSHGAYVTTKVSVLSGNKIPKVPMEVIVAQLFQRLDIPIEAGKAYREYNEGRTTQVPVRLQISTGSRRITRQVFAGAQRLYYDKPTKPQRSPS